MSFKILYDYVFINLRRNIMISVIPMPLKVKELSGSFSMTEKTTVHFDEELSSASKFYNEIFKNVFLTDTQVCENADVVFVSDKSLPEEEYELSISSDKIEIKASTFKGALYAIQTLRQLGKFDTSKGKKALSVSCVKINDAPRYSWRGQMLDCSRHFFSVDEIKRLLDLMLLHKLNIFHWHLTDDQGWRIEIKKYPLLTEIGAKRKATQRTGWKEKNIVSVSDPERDNGYYTQEEVKEVVKYAEERGITVIPEIDMPAHFTAAEAAYPELACRKLDTDVAYYFGAVVPKTQLGYKDNSWNRSACLGKQFTYDFIYDIIDEVCELFPAPYFHIGGDEAPRDEWKKCPDCQKVIKEKGLNSVDELQGYFNNQINEYVKKKGKRLIGWNEILGAKNLDKSIIGQYWTPKRDKKAENYVNSGGQMILSRQMSFYFDYPNCEVKIKNTYNFEPSKSGVKPEAEKNILGVEGELWTEFVHTIEKVDFNLFPRLAAVSEVGWTPKEKKDFKSFVARLDDYESILKELGVDYAPRKFAINNNLLKRAKYMRNFFFKNPDLEVEDARK